MLQQILAQPLPFETAFSHFVQSFANPSLDYFFQTITNLGNPLVWVFLIAFIYWAGNEKRSFFLAFSVLLSGAIAGVGKPLIGRMRPNPADFIVLGAEDGYSFPSGHAVVVASVFGYYYEKFKKNAKFAGAAIVGLVMLSRIYLGVHFLLDVIFGALIGFVVGRAVHFFEGNYSKIRLHEKMIIEEVGLVGAVLFALAISAVFRPLAVVSGPLGFFAGMFLFKLLKMNSTRVFGTVLWVKEIIGFAVLGAIAMASPAGLEPEAYFVGGIWITFLYPFLYEKIARPMPHEQAYSNPAVLAARPEPITLKKKSKRK